MATKPTIQEDAQTSAIMARLANNPELHQALNTSPEILASHAIPETMQGTNNPDQWHVDLCASIAEQEPSENLKALRDWIATNAQKAQELDNWYEAQTPERLEEIKNENDGMNSHFHQSW